MPITLHRALLWTAGILLATLATAVLLVWLLGWNWLRGPIDRLAVEKTGRVLVIAGDVQVRWGWPLPRVTFGQVRFANPSWALEPQMVRADAVEVTFHLPDLLRGDVVLPEVRLQQAVVGLERGSEGRRNWLMDLQQQDPSTAIRIDRLTVDHGTLGYDDAADKTRIRADVSSQAPAAGGGVAFDARGQFRGLALSARGSGGPVLALRDERTPYPIKVDASFGATRVQAEGNITSLVNLVALEWQLDLADLGPLIGARPGTLAAARQVAAPAGPIVTATPARARVLPDLPFKTDRWDSVDADVSLKVGTIRRAKELPLENLVARLRLKDSVLTLDPLDFGLAGGTLSAVITLDGGKSPIQAHAVLRARKIQIASLFPTVDLSQNSIGQLNGEFDLRGVGNSVGTMLATSNGKLGLVVAGGEVSQLMMEKAGLHLWEILQLNLSGDQRIKLRCAVAEFTVQKGNMHADALVFDTAVTTLNGKGDINLARETLDLRFFQDTKNTSPLALRSPIHVRGSFVRPEVGVDKAQVAARALGALALGIVNPLLALIPLIDAGPGKDSDCGQLVRDARATIPRKPAASAPVR